jgi:uncharacterized membrane protein YfcA
MALLALAFLCTALLYASVGFGGGSSYNALLMISGADYRIVPLVSLMCNVIVVSGGIWHFYRHQHLQITKILPWIIFSVPAAFIGGLIPVSEVFFVGLLGLVLLLSGLRLLWPENAALSTPEQPRSVPPFMPALLGSALGLVAGITGIGGGIFLAPILYFIGWDHAKRIAATCSVFILVNSLSGMVGQMLKLNDTGLLLMALPYWVLLPAVFAGGQIGSWLGAGPFRIIVVKKMTALLIIYVAARLLSRFFNLI